MQIAGHVSDGVRMLKKEKVVVQTDVTPMTSNSGMVLASAGDHGVTTANPALQHRRVSAQVWP